MPGDRIDPLFVLCEGSDADSDYCPMCGDTFVLAPPIPPHRRPDILAMLDRGDFDVR